MTQSKFFRGKIKRVVLREKQKERKAKGKICYGSILKLIFHQVESTSVSLSPLVSEITVGSSE